MKKMDNNSLHLLIVDDEEAARYGMRRALTGFGYDIEEAASVEAARSVMKERQTDLLLLDVNLPGVSGLEFLNELKEANGPVRAESGTGKELVAREIHERSSSRRSGAFVAVNCAALPSELIESELFGHEKGAFTGAAVRRRGKFEQADGGTLFLDEIGDMSTGVQAKLLRALEERRVERLGGSESITVDVRFISATHRPLEQEIANH